MMSRWKEALESPDQEGVISVGVVEDGADLTEATRFGMAIGGGSGRHSEKGRV